MFCYKMSIQKCFKKRIPNLNHIAFITKFEVNFITVLKFIHKNFIHWNKMKVNNFQDCNLDIQSNKLWIDTLIQIMTMIHQDRAEDVQSRIDAIFLVKKSIND